MGKLRGKRGELIRVGFDTHAEIDLVGIEFCRLHSLKKSRKAVPPIRGIGRNSAQTYGSWEVPLRLWDSRGRMRDTVRTCVAVDQDSGDCPVLLGMPGLSDLGINLTPRDVSWHFALKREDITLLKPRQFAREAMRSSRVHAVVLSEVLGPDGPDVRPLNEAMTIPPEFANYEEVFRPDKADPLPHHTAADHKIDLIPGTQPPHGTIYPLSPRELEVLRVYLRDALAKGWIRESKSPAGAPILFVPKSDGTLRLCVDYRGLNRITIKNRYPLPLIEDLILRVHGARYFTKIDIKDAYHRLRIAEGDEWKTAFRTRYGHYEYLVLPFGLTNAPATFQSYIHQALDGLLDDFCIAYLDDILIFSATREEHERHVNQVLDRLLKFKLYANLKKCSFFQDSVEFLGYIISADGVAMDEKRVAMIKEWPEPKTFHDLQVFLGFCNFYRRFIKGFAHHAAPLSNLLKGMVKGRKPGLIAWGPSEQAAFAALKQAFLEAPLLRHFDPRLPSRVETDASDFAMAGIYSQLFEDGLWHPVAFWSRKFKGPELNYSTADKELFAIVASFDEWRHYLDGAPQNVEVLTDHANLQMLAKQPKLNGRQARWVMKLAPFNFDIKHRPGSSNPADGPSRRPDLGNELDVRDLLPDLKRKLKVMQAVLAPASGDFSNLIESLPGPVKEVWSPSAPDTPVSEWVRVASSVVVNHGRGLRTSQETGASGCSASLDAGQARSKRTWGAFPEQIMPAIIAETITAKEAPLALDVSGDLRSLIKSVQSTDLDCQQAIVAIVGKQPHARQTRGEDPVTLSGIDSASKAETWSLDVDGLVRKDGLVFVPQEASLRQAILKAYHDSPHAGHFGKGRTLALLIRKFAWNGMARDVEEYVRSCRICQGSKARRHRPHGLLQPLPIPDHPWEEISMDFITGLPPVFNGQEDIDAILVIVDRLTKYCLFLPTTTTLTAAGLEELLNTEVWNKFGPPRGIVSDRGSIFTSSYWEEVCYLMQVKRRLSTAFHPQTDGQTERANQVLEQYLRCFVSDNHYAWPSLLLSAQFAANNAVNVSTNTSPNEFLMGYRPDFNLIAEAGSRPEGVPAAEHRIRKLAALREDARKKMIEAQQQQKSYYDKKHKHIQFDRGDLVLLSTKNIRLKVPQKKLAPKFIGPFRVLEKIGNQAYRLALPDQYDRLHNVFPVTLLEPFVARTGSSADVQEDMPMPALDEDPDEWEIEKICDKKKVKGQVFYLIQWMGWPTEYNQWIAEDDVHAPEAIADYEGKGKKRKQSNQS